MPCYLPPFSRPRLLPPRPDVDATLADICQLQSRRESRDARGIHVIEGVGNFVRAAERGMDFRLLVVSKALLQVGLAKKLVRRLRTGPPSPLPGGRRLAGGAGRIRPGALPAAPPSCS
jgi:hypothetical protein